MDQLRYLHDVFPLVKCMMKKLRSRCYGRCLSMSAQQASGTHRHRSADNVPYFNSWWLFPRVRGLRKNIRQFNPRLPFFFFKVEISSRKLIPLFRPGSVHSGSASCDDYDRVFPVELRVSSFPDRFPHSARITA